MRISYAITAHNEHEELERLLNQLEENITDQDEMVVQLDTTATEEVKQVCGKYPRLKVVEFSLNKDFASFKNNLKANCVGDWIFQIDADEYLDPWLIKNLPSVLQQNPQTEMFFVPRINTVEGLTEEHVQRWRWKVDQNGRVNFPDYQTRIMKNVPAIRWIHRVHEVVTGHTTYGFFPTEDEYCILHHKTIERQEKQNNLYDAI